MNHIIISSHRILLSWHHFLRSGIKSSFLATQELTRHNSIKLYTHCPWANFSSCHWGMIIFAIHAEHFKNISGDISSKLKCNFFRSQSHLSFFILWSRPFPARCLYYSKESSTSTNAVIATVGTSHAGMFTAHAPVPTNLTAHATVSHVEILHIVGSKRDQEFVINVSLGIMRIKNISFVGLVWRGLTS